MLDFSGLSKLLTNELNVKVVPLQQFDGIHVAKSINLAEAKLAEYFNCVGCSLSPLDILDSKKTGNRCYDYGRNSCRCYVIRRRTGRDAGKSTCRS